MAVTVIGNGLGKLSVADSKGGFVLSPTRKRLRLTYAGSKPASYAFQMGLGVNGKHAGL